MNKNDLVVALNNVRTQIQTTAQKSNSKVILLAVSKHQSSEKLRWAYEAGQIDFGENYVQEVQKKRAELDDLPLRWHFIGTLQKNKVKDVVGKFELIHSVDSLELAQKISQKAVEKNVKQKILLEVNLGQETSKSGFSKIILLDQFMELTKLPNLILSGLMILPPPLNHLEEVRPYFQQLRELFAHLKELLPEVQKNDWSFLSMGTSHDFTIAIEEGSNLVRVGTAIFGERK